MHKIKHYKIKKKEKFMKERIKQLVEELNKASEVYYSGHDEIMSNYEYDTKYDELLKLEAETGYSPDNN